MIFFLNILITIIIIIIYHKLVQLLRSNLERTQCKSKGISSGYNQSGNKCQSIHTHTSALTHGNSYSHGLVSSKKKLKDYNAIQR